MMTRSAMEVFLFNIFVHIFGFHRVNFTNVQISTANVKKPSVRNLTVLNTVHNCPANAIDSNSSKEKSMPFSFVYHSGIRLGENARQDVSLRINHHLNYWGVLWYKLKKNRPCSVQSLRYMLNKVGFKASNQQYWEKTLAIIKWISSILDSLNRLFCADSLNSFIPLNVII